QTRSPACPVGLQSPAFAAGCCRRTARMTQCSALAASATSPHAGWEAPDAAIGRAGAKPFGVRPRLRALLARPRALRASLGALRARPRALRARPGTLRARRKASRAKPG